jgi:CheY-like chemotaxis protein
VINASDAMPEGGRLTVETANARLDEAYFAQHAAEPLPGDYVMVAVSDTGQGMDAVTRQHIFEPFFTTKARGKGTGLGLATVFGIVKQHLGHIWVYSEPGCGTTIKVFLPRSPEALAPAAVVATASPTVRGSEIVLVVEDEAMVRDLVCDTLRGQGYTVLPAAGPLQALALAAEFTGTIDLLLTDVIMPDLNGRELYQQLVAERPQLEVLYMSGYTDNAIAHHGVLNEGLHFLQKPFALPDLLQKVRQALD